MKMNEVIKRCGTEEDFTHILGNEFELITRHIVRRNDVSVEYELYRDGERIYNPDMLDEQELPDDQYENYEDAIRAQKTENWMISVEEGVLENKFGWIPKNVWYAVGETYQIKDSLKSAGMVWDVSMKVWASLTKPDLDGVEFVQMKTYHTKNEWTLY